jgi:hypothetical protein
LSNAKIAQELAFTTNQVDEHRRGVKKPSAVFIAKFCQRYGYNSAWVLTGNGEKYTMPSEPATNPEVKEPISPYGIEAEHIDLIPNFLNKSLAKEVNEDLICIERMDAAAFKEIASYIKGVAKGIKMASGPRNQSGWEGTEKDERGRIDEDPRTGGSAGQTEGKTGTGGSRG